MRWLLDGYNVIRRDPALKSREAESLEAGRRALLHLVARVARDSLDEFVVVFDGARVGGGPVGAAGARVQAVFSRPPQTADDVLRDLARRGREGVIVVTSDRAVADATRRAGAAAVTTEAFLAALEAPPDDEDDADADEDDRPPPRRGNPRRLSREARAAARALRRLRPRP